MFQPQSWRQSARNMTAERTLVIGDLPPLHISSAWRQKRR